MKFIPTSTTGVKQRFGKFVSLQQPGLNFYIPFVEKITKVSNMVKSLDLVFKVKTKDNVFTEIHVSVQLQIKPEDTEKAFFKLFDPKTQIGNYVQNIIRSVAPKMNLDELYESQNDIARSVSIELKDKMLMEYGHTIRDTLINDIKPAAEVSDAMNKINASERLKQAAKNEADANYIKVIRQAEADKDRKILQGEGISGQRLAILKGYETGVENMAKSLGLTSLDIIKFVMSTQHLDTLEAIGKSQNTKTIFMSHDPEDMASKFANKMMHVSEKQ